MKTERTARLFVIGLAFGLPLAALVARWARPPAIEIHGRLAENGGWTPGDLRANVGEPLQLRLTSDDVMHGFAIGQSDKPAVDVKPGEITELTLTFDKPGKYLFYCTRWCGPNHWRMHGTIEVVDPRASSLPVAEVVEPLYVTLGLDLDAPHPANVIPSVGLSAERGTRLAINLPTPYLSTDYYAAHSPVEVWRALRADPITQKLNDADVWDLVALIWQANSTPESLVEGQRLYAANCAACHGESGKGDGVMARWLGNSSPTGLGGNTQKPADFTEASKMLGASPALLQGKIIRGGMGTGMPYWGPIVTEAQTWALVNYLWRFQFNQ